MVDSELRDAEIGGATGSGGVGASSSAQSISAKKRCTAASTPGDPEREVPLACLRPESLPSSLGW